ncbi:chlorophyll a/b-binding protein domain-containing protein [Pelagophyceae sp. CCMP2097]|nr:chlorophyll a/b-binding protein domain-containing protein [Pelagophyceae sp. CCMP2097]
MFWTRRRRRITEIKHGRVAMAAFTGYLVQEVFQFPGYLSKTADLQFSDVPNGLNAITVVPGLGWFQMIMVIGWLEAGPYAAAKNEGKQAGDLGWPYFGRKIQDPDEKMYKLNIELNNGRAAMIGIIGLLSQDAVNGEVFIF